MRSAYVTLNNRSVNEVNKAVALARIVQVIFDYLFIEINNDIAYFQNYSKLFLYLKIFEMKVRKRQTYLCNISYYYFTNTKIFK